MRSNQKRRFYWRSGTPTYYNELNDRSMEKIWIYWNMASWNLRENHGGDITGFLQEYLAEEEKHFAERQAVSGDAATSGN